MEDENFQEVTFRPDTNRTHVTEVLYVPGVPDLTIETDGLGFGVSRLIWSKQARELSRPALLPTSITEFNYDNSNVLIK